MNDLKNEEIKLSVIVPIYNVDQYLEKCIESIIHQTYTNLDIILVDDGSTDKSGEICDKYAVEDNRITVIHKENGGPDSARKEGISKSKGDYIAYVDGDDWIEPDMYASMIEHVKKYSVNTVICGIVENYSDRERMREPFLTEGLYDKEYFKNNLRKKIFYTGDFFRSSITSSLSDKIIKKSIIEKYQKRDGLETSLSDDTMVAIPAVIDGQSIFVMKKCLYHYRMRENSLKHSLSKLDYKQVVQKSYKTWKTTLQMASPDYDYENDLKTYILYVFAMKVPGFFDEVLGKQLALYGGIEKGSKLILYGAGQTGIVLMDYIKSHCDVQIVAWADRDYDRLSLDYELTDPKKIKNLEYDYLLVTMMRRDAYESAKKDIVRYGVDDSKICWIDDNILDNAGYFIDKIVKDE